MGHAWVTEDGGNPVWNHQILIPQILSVLQYMQTSSANKMIGISLLQRQIQQ